MTNMLEKQAVSLTVKIPNADLAALRLFQWQLALDPKDQPTAEEVPCNWLISLWRSLLQGPSKS